MNIFQIRQATQFWLAPSQTQDISDSLARLNAANLARDDMVAGIITVDDFLDVLSDLEIDIDTICADFNHNFAILYGTNPIITS